MDSIYLALDQALQTTGWCLFDSNGKVVQYGAFTIPASKAIESRLYDLWQHLDDIVNKIESDKKIKIVFEDIQSQQNIQTFKKLAYCQASILLYCYNKDYKYSTLSPSQWRKIIKDKYGIAFGRSRADQKSNARKFVFDHYGLEVSEDTADAICIGTAYLIDKNRLTKESAF